MSTAGVNNGALFLDDKTVLTPRIFGGLHAILLEPCSPPLVVISTGTCSQTNEHY